MFHFENSYYVPHSRVTGYACKTNLPSNTAFRGFGAPQGMFAAETMIRHIADYLKKDVVKVFSKLHFDSSKIRGLVYSYLGTWDNICLYFYKCRKPHFLLPMRM